MDLLRKATVPYGAQLLHMDFIREADIPYEEAFKILYTNKYDLTSTAFVLLQFLAVFVDDNNYLCI